VPTSMIISALRVVFKKCQKDQFSPTDKSTEELLTKFARIYITSQIVM
jgi:hypothetical protein